MKNAYGEFPSAAEVIALNYFNTVALNKSEEGVSSRREGFVLVLEKTQDLQRRRLAFFHSWDYLPLFPLFHVSHLPCLSFFSRAQASFEVPLGEMGIVV